MWMLLASATWAGPHTALAGFDDQVAARDALAAVGERLLHARAGRPRLNELELVEPSLFLRHVPQAATRLVRALLDRLAQPGSRRTQAARSSSRRG